jgi:hypothetical protein
MLPAIGAAYGDLSSGSLGLVFTCFYAGTVIADVSAVVALRYQQTSGCLAALGCTDDIRTSRRWLLMGLFFISAAAVGFFIVPDAIAEPPGSHGMGFLVFLLLCVAFGIGSESVTISTSTICSSWDERCMGQATILLHFGFAAGAVSSPYLHQAISGDVANRQDVADSFWMRDVSQSHENWRLTFIAHAVYALLLVPLGLFKDFRDAAWKVRSRASLSPTCFVPLRAASLSRLTPLLRSVLTCAAQGVATGLQCAGRLIGCCTHPR